MDYKSEESMIQWSIFAKNFSIEFAIQKIIYCIFEKLITIFEEKIYY